MKVSAVLASLVSAQAAFASTSSAFETHEKHSLYLEGLIKQLSFHLEADVLEVRSCVDTGSVIREHIQVAIEEATSKDVVKIVHSLQTLVDIYLKDLPSTMETCKSIELSDEIRAPYARVATALKTDRELAVRILSKNIKSNALPLTSAVAALLAAKKADKPMDAGKRAADVLVNLLVGDGSNSPSEELDFPSMFSEEDMDAAFTADADFQTGLVKRLTSLWRIKRKTASEECKASVKTALDLASDLPQRHGVNVLGWLYLLSFIDGHVKNELWDACESTDMNSLTKYQLDKIIHATGKDRLRSIWTNYKQNHGAVRAGHKAFRAAKKAGDHSKMGKAYAEVIDAMLVGKYCMQDEECLEDASTSPQQDTNDAQSFLMPFVSLLPKDEEARAVFVNAFMARLPGQLEVVPGTTSKKCISGLREVTNSFGEVLKKVSEYHFFQAAIDMYNIQYALTEGVASECSLTADMPDETKENILDIVYDPLYKSVPVVAKRLVAKPSTMIKLKKRCMAARKADDMVGLGECFADLAANLVLDGVPPQRMEKDVIRM